MLKYVLLGFLATGESWTGYDLKSVIDQSTANFWHAHHSQIYTTLHRMEEAGLVHSQIETQEDRPDKRVYSITETGQEDLASWLEHPLTGPTTVKDVLLVKLFFSQDRDNDDLLAELRLQRSLHEQRLNQYETETRAIIAHGATSSPRHAKAAPYWEMTRRFGVAYEEMYLAWLEEIIVEIQTGELIVPEAA
jgi:DNA-binding PadR family transcriptional regulator